jgi:hypothetical protein
MKSAQIHPLKNAKSLEIPAIIWQRMENALAHAA